VRRERRRNHPYDLPEDRRPSSAPLVARIRTEVDAWRGSDHPGASATTQRLLQPWFLDEHRSSDGLPFRYYFAQREAVETMIYLHEVAWSRTLADLAQRYASTPVAAHRQDFPATWSRWPPGRARRR